MIQVYTGDGKGKTTAALGLALRASGAGLKVYICQFLKGKSCSELVALKKFKNVKVEQFGTGFFVKGAPCEKDIAQARRGLEAVKIVLASKNCDLLILDEIHAALNIGLVNLEELLALIKSAAKEMEIVLTGRRAPQEIIKLADLVSDIKEVKHYYHKGLKARKGIEF